MSITHRTVAAFAAMCVAGAVVSARQAAPPPAQQSKAVVMKGRAPVSTSLLKINLPRPAEADLANGIHLMVLEDHRLPQVTFQLSFPAPAGISIPRTRRVSHR